MLRETSSTSTPPDLPLSSPRAASALPRPVSVAATASPTSAAPKAMRTTSVRRTARPSSAVVASGITAPRIRLSRMSVRPLVDHAADVERQRLGGGWERRRLGPRELAGQERQLGLAASRQLPREQLERLPLLRRALVRALDEHDGPLERTEDTETELADPHEAQQREEAGREQQARGDEQQRAQQARRDGVRHRRRRRRRAPARRDERIGARNVDR